MADTVYPHRYDATLKFIFQTPPQRLLRMVVGQEASELLTVEFPTIRKRLPDLLVRLKNGNICHLELQSGGDADMHWRMLEYYVFIRRLYPTDQLIQIVLFVGDGEPVFSLGIEEEMLSFRYTVRNIRDVDCSILLASESMEENVLAILCRMPDERGTIRKILSRIANLGPKAKVDTLEQLVILAGLRKLESVISEEVKEMAISVNVMENDFLKDLFMKGRWEGRQEGESALLTRQLQRRFGTLPAWANEKISQADLSSLEEWSLRIFDAKSLDEVFSDKA
ncbi:MAG: DUF4351 domain-containing protein [Magnetococcales bacterium]|nr:DUF4351 domain-containing protein [Magnetococcales bacterium]